MIKVLGAVFVVGASYLFGIWQSQKYVNRNRELMDFRELFTEIRDNMNFGLGDIVDILERLKIRKNGVVEDLLSSITIELNGINTSSFGAIWERNVKEIYNRCSLNKSDIDDIVEMGSGVGNKASLEYYIKRLDDKIAESNADLTKRCNTVRTLSVFAGIAIVIVLI